MTHEALKYAHPGYTYIPHCSFTVTQRNLISISRYQTLIAICITSHHLHIHPTPSITPTVHPPTPSHHISHLPLQISKQKQPLVLRLNAVRSWTKSQTALFCWIFAILHVFPDVLTPVTVYVYTRKHGPYAQTGCSAGFRIHVQFMGTEKRQIQERG